MSNKLLKKEHLGKLIEAVNNAGSIFVAPKMDARQVVFAAVTNAEELAFDYIIPRNSFKEFLFLQTEPIAKFNISKEGVVLKGVDVDQQEVVVFGSRPCDAIGCSSLRSVFNRDFKDDFYNNRDSKTIVISVACIDSDDSCSCTTVNLTPDSKDGSDILLRQTKDGDYAVEAVTDKGRNFEERFKDIFSHPPSAVSLKPIADVKPKKGIDIEKVKAQLKDTRNYENPIWAGLSKKCIGCGACTFVCPTCHCFDIADEGSAFEGERMKNWDACQFEFFTLHTSGHNPRDTQYKRWRNRFMCKFNFYPNKFESYGCVGCGRCIRVCPVRLDITEAMEEITSLR